ncbi:hypothetical protein JCM19037_3431 [Geomicrobium sp. JCM 19037]|uniref:hypothetical protein n=1 Tax=Geomicrobium sp. JCM 19037 TaxID=1460634 RepID=UPI00045F1590|nr:hypothetical protein [Geomicrobium sp. JCM 19037]GAK04971.1 hypothetical protein JCM19037_3431 [Geomicrobium sp. JCM 19037]
MDRIKPIIGSLFCKIPILLITFVFTVPCLCLAGSGVIGEDYDNTFEWRVRAELVPFIVIWFVGATLMLFRDVKVSGTGTLFVLFTLLYSVFTFGGMLLGYSQ